MVAAHLVVSAQLSCYAFCCSLQTCYLFIPELPLCFGGKQFMFMSKIHESLSKCIYSSFVEVITKVLNTLIQTARVPWILNLVTRKKKKRKEKHAGFHFSERIRCVSDFWVCTAPQHHLQPWHCSLKSPEKQLQFLENTGVGVMDSVLVQSHIKTYFVTATTHSLAHPSSS